MLQSGAIYILRGLLDCVGTGIPLTEERRHHLVEQIPGIAGSYDDGNDVADDIRELSSTINRWS
jgi:hypothetical protein